MQLRRALLTPFASMRAGCPSDLLDRPDAWHSTAQPFARIVPGGRVLRSTVTNPVGSLGRARAGRAGPAKLSLRWVVWAALGLAAGCGQDVSAPTGPTSTRIATPAADTSTAVADPLGAASRVVISGLPVIGMIDQEFILSARLMPGDVPASDSVTWMSSDPSVATVGGADWNGSPGLMPVTIVGQGEVTITVSTKGLTESRQLRAVAVDPPLSDELAVDAFSVVELSYSDTTAADVHWYYAPLVVVRDQTNVGVHVYAIQLEIPGISSTYCTSLRDVDAGQSLELFREVYGDYELTFDRPGYRAAPGNATATVYFFGGDGGAGKVVATGPIESGPAFRNTYTGGAIIDPWGC